MTTTLARQHYRWNFTLWVLETAAWMLGTALIDSTTVLPVLVQSLTGSTFLSGLIISLRFAGQGWPQLISASLVSGRTYRKYYYLLVSMPGRLLLLWPAALLLAGVTDPAVVAPAIFIGYTAFWMSEGMSIVPWVDMLGKTIPPTRRGRLFASMHVLGGMLGIGAGLWIRWLLQSPTVPYPVGYGVLFLAACIALTVSALSLGVLREPPSPHDEQRYSTLALIKDIPNLLVSMPPFRLLVLVQALFGFAVLPAPFYILYASGLLRSVVAPTAGTESIGVGIFLSVQTAGMIVGNTALGFLGDHYGNRLMLRVLALFHVLVPMSAMLAGYIARAAGLQTIGIYLAFFPTFFIFGSLLSGTWMGVTNYLLELAPADDRPAYIAVMNALNIPAVLLPMIGGLLLRSLGFPGIFLIAIIALSTAFFLTGRLIEPRGELAHHHKRPDPWP